MPTISEIAQRVHTETVQLNNTGRLDCRDSVLEEHIRRLTEEEVSALLDEFAADGQYTIGVIPFAQFGSFVGISTVKGAIKAAKQAILFAALKRLMDNTWGSDFAQKLKYLQGIS
jgi:hypothetical protein